MIIAIDGPAASGKSTVARALARELGLTFLDTGAMYRAVTLAVLRRGIDPGDGEACGRVAGSVELEFDAAGRIRIDGEEGEPAIRGAEVTREVSRVAAHPEVRRAIVPQQQGLARRSVRGVVAEGRDTTTVVFPAADYKFFLTASSSERARRRAREIGQPDEEQRIRAELERRDRYDSTRADSPLVQAEDALPVATDGVGVEQIVASLVRTIEEGQRRKCGSR